MVEKAGRCCEWVPVIVCRALYSPQEESPIPALREGRLLGFSIPGLELLNFLFYSGKEKEGQSGRVGGREGMLPVSIPVAPATIVLTPAFPTLSNMCSACSGMPCPCVSAWAVYV